MSIEAMYLGLDLSTQSLTGVVIDTGERRVVWQHSLEFDREFPGYRTWHGVLPQSDALVATSSPLMWTEALDRLMEILARDSGLDLSRLKAISGAGQQHGTVYLNAGAGPALERLDPRKPLVDQVPGMLSRDEAPIWMDASTGVQCQEISDAVGGREALQRLTGSPAFERFAGPQIRKFAQQHPGRYAETDRIHLVSSFMASLLIGEHAPLEPGDAAGMNLMDIAHRRWSEAALDATAPQLRERLPAIVPSPTIVGRLNRYWTDRYGFPAVPVIAWTGDNPSSAVGVGLTDTSRGAISLGTSDTVFGLMDHPEIDPTGASNVFGAPTGQWLGLVCFRNGSLARQRVRDQFGLDWPVFSATLKLTPAGNGGAIMLPWFEPEITPHVLAGGPRRFELDPGDAVRNVRAVVEGQMLAMKRHSAWMGGVVTTILATGGAARNREVLQVMADVFDATVHQLDVGASAALGAALRAWHGAAHAEGKPVEWPDVVTGFVRARELVTPDQRNVGLYRQMMMRYAAFEAEALQAS